MILKKLFRKNKFFAGLGVVVGFEGAGDLGIVGHNKQWWRKQNQTSISPKQASGFVQLEFHGLVFSHHETLAVGGWFLFTYLCFTFFSNHSIAFDSEHPISEVFKILAELK
jgi:hypothetical protein